MGKAGRYEMTFILKGDDRATSVLEKVDGKFKNTATQAEKTARDLRIWAPPPVGWGGAG